jgi:hypothetical protein
VTFASPHWANRRNELLHVMRSSVLILKLNIFWPLVRSFVRSFLRSLVRKEILKARKIHNST